MNVFDTLQKDQDAMDDSSTASLTVEQLIKKLNEHSAVTKGRKKDIFEGYSISRYVDIGQPQRFFSIRFAVFCVIVHSLFSHFQCFLSI